MRFRKKQDLQEFLQQVLLVLSGEFLQHHVKHQEYQVHKTADGT